MITREGGQLALGICLGAGTLLLFLIYFPVVPLPFKLSDGVVGAIVGGLIAGTVTLASQILIIVDTAQRKQKDEYDRGKSNALAIFLKVQTMMDQGTKGHNYYRTFNSSTVLTIKDFGDLHKPLRSERRRVSFDEVEKTFLIWINATDLFNTINDLNGIFSNYYMLEEKYAEQFDMFQREQTRTGSVKIEGNHVTSSGQADPLACLELADILGQIRYTLISGKPLWQKAHQEIVEILSKKFNTRIGTELNDAISGVSDFGKR